MSETRFAFIKDSVIRTHLDRTFALILELITLSEASIYTEELKGSFRKTIIIYTASIIEALLLLILQNKKTEAECGDFKDIVGETLYHIDDTKRIVIVEKRFSSMKFSKINLDQVNKICKKERLVAPELSERINKVRDLRNRQHLGSLSEIEVMYTKQDLEFVFSVAKEVTIKAEKILL